MKNTLLLISLLISLNLVAQKEGNIWYFGNNAGIDFNGPTPVAITNSALISVEGCASICDSSGSLLFYTNGEKIWNKNHSIMPGGWLLAYSQTSTQVAAIVKKPGSSTIYYVFTVSPQGYVD